MRQRRAVRFLDAFESFSEIRRRQLSNGKHVQQWLNTMRDYVFSVIRDRPVADISAGDVIDVLKPIWLTKGKKGQPLSDSTLSKLMRDAGRPGTPHGFRSAFKDWAAEHGVRDEVSEAGLAHVDRGKVRAAYRRTRFKAERVPSMEGWADFVTSLGDQR